MWVAIIAFLTSFLVLGGACVLLFRGPTATARLTQLAGKQEAGKREALKVVKKAPLGARIERITRAFHQLLPRSANEVSFLQKRLARAGFRGSSYVNIFYAAKVLVPAAMALLATVTGAYRASPLFIYGMAVGLGFLAPDFWLDKKISSRKLDIRLGLSDALDLLVICVEAGLGLDKATVRAAEELRLSHPAIADELNMVTLEQQAGRPRGDAWTHFADRTEVDTVRALASILIQAEKFGTSVGKTLRTHADELRIQRRQEAEERAGSLAAKIVFPLVLFIFPSLFLVTLGPSMIKMFEAFDTFFK